MYDIINMSKRPIILTCNGVLLSCCCNNFTCDLADPYLVLECHHNIVDMCRPTEVCVRLRLGTFKGPAIQQHLYRLLYNCTTIKV